MSKRRPQLAVIRPAGVEIGGTYKTVQDAALLGLSQAARTQLAQASSKLSKAYPKNQLLELWASNNWQKKDPSTTLASVAAARGERVELAKEQDEKVFKTNLDVVALDFAKNFGDAHNFVNGRFITPEGKYISKKDLKPFGKAFRESPGYETWNRYRGMQVTLAWNSFVNKLNTFISGNTAKGQIKLARRIRTAATNKESGLTALKGLISAVRKKPQLYSQYTSIEDIQSARLENALKGMSSGQTEQIKRIQASMNFNKTKLGDLLGGGGQQQIPQSQAQIIPEQQIFIEAPPIIQQVQQSQSTTSTILTGEGKTYNNLEQRIRDVTNKKKYNTALNQIIGAQADGKITDLQSDALIDKLKIKGKSLNLDV